MNAPTVKILLNGEPFEAPDAVTVSELLQRLEIDARRVAVEHNLTVLKRAAYGSTTLREGDQVEIVNFVGGGSGCDTTQRWELRSRNWELNWN